MRTDALLSRNWHVRRISVLSAFTVIELAVVIAIIAVVISLGMPSFRSFIQFSSLQNDTWRILSDLRNFRYQAIVEHVDYRFTFDAGLDRYTVEQRDYITGALIKAVKTVPFANDLTGGGDVTFHPRGNATVGAAIALHARQGSDSATLSVQSSTGAVQSQVQ